MLSIVSYNVHFGRKINGVASWFARQRILPDIYCFQEFPLDNASSFVHRLPGGPYGVHFAPNFVNRRGQFGVLTAFRSSCINLLTEAAVSMGKGSVVDTVLTRATPQRFALVSWFQHGKKRFSLANLHLSCLARNTMRLRQLKEVLGCLNGSSSLVASSQVLLGDFNFSSLAQQMRLFRFMGEFGFTNAYRKTTHQLLFVRHQVDYVFYRHCRVRLVSADHLPFSDHGCIRIHIALNEPV